jgi:hypothetical protein
MIGFILLFHLLPPAPSSSHGDYSYCDAECDEADCDCVADPDADLLAGCDYVFGAVELVLDIL